MMMKLFFAFLSIYLLCQTIVFAQIDTVSHVPRYPVSLKQHHDKVLDSALIAQNKLIKDSLGKISDSLSLAWIKAPNPKRTNQFLESFVDLYQVKNLDFSSWTKKFPKKINQYNTGKQMPKGESWILLVIFLLIIFFAIIKNAFSKELSSIIQSLYSNRILSQLNKEDNLLSSWPFTFLYLLFGLTIGMYLYLLERYFGLEYEFNGFKWFLILSVLIIALFTLKIIVLRLLGFLFGIQRAVKEYTSILYLSYFNIAIVFLPLLVAFSLTPGQYNLIYRYISVFLLLIIIAWQFLRAGSTILSNYQFPKVYLFIYLCNLEICPLLILIKVLRF